MADVGAAGAKSGRAGHRPAARWSIRLAAALGLLLVALGGGIPPRGPVLVEIISPAPGEEVGIEGLEVFVRLSPGGEVLPETMRVLLNGADVTAALTTGENGAYGKLHALLDGENVLRVEVFGRVPWGAGQAFEQAREVVVRLRRPLYPFRG